MIYLHYANILLEKKKKSYYSLLLLLFSIIITIIIIIIIIIYILGVKYIHLYYAWCMTLQDMYHLPYIASLFGCYLKNYTWSNLYYMLCQASTNITPNIR
jgi:hypothetical protein